MEKDNLSFIDFNLKLAHQHANLFKNYRIDDSRYEDLENLIEQSLKTTRYLSKK